MSQEPNAVEQAVTRALRDNLATLQRLSDELQQAVADVVASCASSRPTNSLPPLVRAQALAASLGASLEVLARFVAIAAQPARAVAEEVVTRAVTLPAPERAPVPVAPPHSVPTPMAEAAAAPAVEEEPAEEVQRVGTGAAYETPMPSMLDTVRSHRDEPAAEVAAVAAAEPAMEAPPEFDLHSLPAAEQEMHRRANRVAKVSMQDIKMLKKQEVLAGRENQDLCIRLKDELDKARKEYERRFRPILSHPVDYFYQWAVEILADGNPDALGEYPYPSTVAKR